MSRNAPRAVVGDDPLLNQPGVKHGFGSGRSASSDTQQERAASSPSGPGVIPSAISGLNEITQDAVASYFVPNEHFFRPSEPARMPWEMTIDERRKWSKDPRIRKQVADEEQWNGTVAEGVWRRIRVFAKPSKDWLLTPEEFCELLASAGIVGSHMTSKLLVTFDPHQTGFYNALVVCKIFEITLTNPRYCEELLRHCFNQFDRANPDDDFLRRDILQRAKLANPAESHAGGPTSRKAGGGDGGQRRRRAGGGGTGTSPATMVSGASYDMLEGLKKCWDAGSIVTDRDDILTYAEFCAGMQLPANREWIASFLPSFFEVAAARFAPPGGTLPLVPLRWLVTTEPIPFSDEMADADVLLLREIDQLGVDPFVAKKEKKKHSQAAGAAGKK